MIASKALWEVSAGVLPGAQCKKLYREFSYDSGEYDQDAATSRIGDNRTTIFEARRDEAFDYARSIMNPANVNWVRIEFIWF